MAEERQKLFEFHSPVDLLKHTASEFNRLQEEATQALTVDKNVDEVQTKLASRAQLLIDLPAKMAKLVEENGSKFSEDDMIQLQQFSHMAEERIKDGDYFGLSTLLISKGHKKGQPNALEKLIKDLS